MDKTLELIPAANTDLPELSLIMNEAFESSVRDNFGSIQGNDPLPQSNDLEKASKEPGAEILKIMLDGGCIGGAVLVIDEKTKQNALNWFFIAHKHHSRGLGLAAWQAIEKRYPDTKVWETGTPYFEKRNIHFYVNKCGFRIVEYFNERHPDPFLDDLTKGKEECLPPVADGGFFRFEKVLDIIQ